jgi:hypothetical protein
MKNKILKLNLISFNSRTEWFLLQQIEFNSLNFSVIILLVDKTTMMKAQNKAFETLQ